MDINVTMCKIIKACSFVASLSGHHGVDYREECIATTTLTVSMHTRSAHTSTTQKVLLLRCRRHPVPSQSTRLDFPTTPIPFR
eukprot:m.76789 g.76789  ORF g.76789 m.76789 type:complete len:83 (+) comp24934_c0_seq1:444-692(+)